MFLSITSHLNVERHLTLFKCSQNYHTAVCLKCSLLQVCFWFLAFVPAVSIFCFFFKLLLIKKFVLGIAAPNVSSSSGASILAAAKSQIGVPYSSGGGTIHGKSYGVESGKRIKGFDCAGLAQFAVYNGTGKVISRDVANQYTDRRCSRVPYDQRKQGDLVFFEVATFIHHVGIVASTSTMIHSPHSGGKSVEDNCRLIN